MVGLERHWSDGQSRWIRWLVGSVSLDQSRLVANDGWSSDDKTIPSDDGKSMMISHDR